MGTYGERERKEECLVVCTWKEVSQEAPHPWNGYGTEMSQDAGIRQLLRKYLPDGDWNSVETGATAGGVPDSNYCFPGGIEGWVEGKRTLAWKVEVRPLQFGWHSRRSRQGGRSFIMVRRLSGGKDECYLFPGSRAEEFSRAGSTLKGWVCPMWQGGPDAWNWAEIRGILCRT